MIDDREAAALRVAASTMRESDPVCPHGIARERCVFCGVWRGKVFAARCERCESTTWHHSSDGACVRCGSPA
jgi:hypothetical protein